MKKYVDFDFVKFQKELLAQSPLNLIVNPQFPKFKLFEDGDRYGFNVSNPNYERFARNLPTAIEEMKAEYIRRMELDCNTLGSQKAELIEDILIKKYPDYGFYCPYDISGNMGVEIQITKYYEEEEFTWTPSVWITQNGPVAIKYLTDFMPFDMAIDIIKILTEICQSRISMTYKGKELLCYENGVAV